VCEQMRIKLFSKFLIYHVNGAQLSTTIYIRFVIVLYVYQKKIIKGTVLHFLIGFTSDLLFLCQLPT
jgi:hypothetical protein